MAKQMCPASVTVLGLTKSGKSTLINAILGDYFLHVSNISATSALTHIQASKKAKTPYIRHQKKILASGSPRALFNVIKENNHNIRNAKKEFFDEFTIHVDTDIIPAGSTLIDAPGLNEAANEIVRDMGLRILKRTDYLIVVLDYSQAGTTDEERLWKDIMEHTIVLKDLRRILCVINKIDLMKSTSLNREQMIQFYQEKIEKYVGVQIPKESFVCVSAQRGLDAKMMIHKSKKMTKEQLEDLINYFCNGSSPQKDGYLALLSDINWNYVFSQSNIATVESWIQKKLSDSVLLEKIRTQERDRILEKQQLKRQKEENLQKKIKADNQKREEEISKSFERFLGIVVNSLPSTSDLSFNLQVPHIEELIPCANEVDGKQKIQELYTQHKNLVDTEICGHYGKMQKKIETCNASIETAGYMLKNELNEIGNLNIKIDHKFTLPSLESLKIPELDISGGKFIKIDVVTIPFENVRTKIHYQTIKVKKKFRSKKIDIPVQVLEKFQDTREEIKYFVKSKHLIEEIYGQANKNIPFIQDRLQKHIAEQRKCLQEKATKLMFSLIPPRSKL